MATRKSNQPPTVRVQKVDDGWRVKRDDASRASKITDTKAEAVKAAREIAKNAHAELIIHGENGRIQSRDSEGNDPKGRG